MPPPPSPPAPRCAGARTRLLATLSPLLLGLATGAWLAERVSEGVRAEEIAVLDLMSGGRFSFVAGLGYRPEEYAAMDRDWAGRGAAMDHVIETLLQAWTGEPFEYGGHTIRVTPKPLSRPHPPFAIGGMSRVAARRAARFGVPFFPALELPELGELYLAECERRGREGVLVVPAEQNAMLFVDEDPERYYRKIEGIVDPLIDYRGFARNVMGPYASSERYRSLDEKGRARLRDQLDRFTAAMRHSLVRTYSKGLLAFGGSHIEVLPPEEGKDYSDRASVRQHVFADRDEPYRVLYQMGRDRSGQWKLRNVIIEDVNLGEIYRDQFLAAAREEKGDLDEVIEKWTTVEVDVED